MDKNIIYLRATDDWTRGVFATYKNGGWHYVYWNYPDETLDPVFNESVEISAAWAYGITRENDVFPVYQEYKANDNAPL